MTTLTIGVMSELALPADVLQHLGAAYRGKLRLRLMPDGRADLTAGRSGGS